MILKYFFKIKYLLKPLFIKFSSPNLDQIHVLTHTTQEHQEHTQEHSSENMNPSPRKYSGELKSFQKNPN